MTHFPIYSPEEELADKRMQVKGLRLFVKRDDMIHPFISGNKWRKLKYQLEDARRTGKTHLVSFGGAYSNHLLALAAAAAKYGFTSTGFVRGEEVQPLNDTLFLCRQFGMELVFVPRQAYRDKKMELFNQRFSGDTKAYFIDEGGRSPLAIKGCAELAGELSRPYDHLFVACGTGSTLAGILSGIAGSGGITSAAGGIAGDDGRTAAAAGIAARKFTAGSVTGREIHPGEPAPYEAPYIEGIAVLKNAAFLEKDIREASAANHPFRLHLDFHQGGYAKAPASFLNWMQDFHREHGLLLDPIYTGKMMYAIFQLAEQNYFHPGSNLLAIHTGGLFGLLGMKDRWS